jgi:outer membrane lipoprotein SlyB
MKTTLITLMLAAGAATLAPAVNAQPAHAPALGARAKAQAECHQCGTVQEVRVEKRKGEGGAAGLIGGAVVGGLLGNQVGKGTGRTLATAGGAAAGAYVGNEVQKKVTSKTVWVTKVKMRDGSTRHFEHEQKPVWKSGSAVRVDEHNALVLR